MKKNVRPIIAILLIIFSVSSSLGSYFINSMNNGYVSTYSDELLNKNNINYNCYDFSPIIHHFTIKFAKWCYVFQASDYINPYVYCP